MNRRYSRRPFPKRCIIHPTRRYSAAHSYISRGFPLMYFRQGAEIPISQVSTSVDCCAAPKCGFAPGSRPLRTLRLNNLREISWNESLHIRRETFNRAKMIASLEILVLTSWLNGEGGSFQVLFIYILSGRERSIAIILEIYSRI